MNRSRLFLLGALAMLVMAFGAIPVADARPIYWYYYTYETATVDSYVVIAYEYEPPAVYHQYHLRGSMTIKHKWKQYDYGARIHLTYSCVVSEASHAMWIRWVNIEDPSDVGEWMPCAHIYGMHLLRNGVEQWFADGGNAYSAVHPVNVWWEHDWNKQHLLSWVQCQFWTEQAIMDAGIYDTHYHLWVKNRDTYTSIGEGEGNPTPAPYP